MKDFFVTRDIFGSPARTSKFQYFLLSRKIRFNFRKVKAPREMGRGPRLVLSSAELVYLYKEIDKLGKLRFIYVTELSEIVETFKKFVENNTESKTKQAENKHESLIGLHVSSNRN